MKFDHHFATAGAFCALAGLVACEAPQKGARGGEAATIAPAGHAARQDPGPAPAQAAFIAWADGLSSTSAMPALNISMKMAMAGNIGDFNPEAMATSGLAPEDQAFAMSLQMGGDVADWTRFRLRLDAQMEIGALKQKSGGRPIQMGCAMVADGATVWVEPDWSKAWFAEDLRQQGVGIENMVFSIQVATVRQLLDVLPLVLPEEQRGLMKSALECTASPAGLVQLTARTSQAVSFSQHDGRVFVELEMLPGIWDSLGAEQAMSLARMFQGQALRTSVEFDQSTGTMLRMEYSLALDGGSLSMSYQTKVVDRPFPADFFRYQLPAGRKAFPVDVFMNPIVMELRRQAGAAADPASNDFEF